MMKRILAVFFSLMLLFSSALAQQDTIASYQLPDGAEVRYLTEAGSLSVPDGLEAMYDLMLDAALQGDVYLIRMPNGRALASVSSTRVDYPRTAEQLLDLWPQIAQSIAEDVIHVNADASCAAVEERYGTQVLHISTDITVGENVVALLKAEAFAFCKGDYMIEVWAVWPDEPLYLYDQTAAAELQSDLSDLDLFLSSLSFGAEPAMLDGDEYTDPDGRFSLLVPYDFEMVTQHTPPHEVDALRERFIAANAQGADQVFDYLMEDVNQQHVTLLLTNDMKGAIALFSSEEPDFAGLTADGLATLAEPIRQMLMDRFGIAITLSATEKVTISGAENALLGYWVRCDECNLQLDVTACVLGQDRLCEVDIYTMDGNQSVRALLSALVTQTLTFHVD